MDQYQQRNDLEIIGISSEVKQDQLEKHVLHIIEKMGVKIKGKKVSLYDVVACHQLKKTSGSTSQNVIIRFNYRNIVSACIQRRKSLIKIRNEYNYNYLHLEKIYYKLNLSTIIVVC